jgi:hypothetical protein
VWGLLAGVLLAALAVWVVLDPVLRPRAPEVPVDTGVDPDDDLSPRAVALRALAEIEFDRATGKLSEDDYESLKARYTRDAVSALRADQPSASRAPAPPPSTSPVIPLTSKRAATPAMGCPVHGVRPEVGAVFCSECGRRLGLEDGDRVCGRCGTLLESGARFCGRCGDRVAA